MNSPEKQNLDRRIQELETEINQSSSAPLIETQPGQPLQTTPHTPDIESRFQQVTNWFNGLSTTGKVIVISVGVIVGFAILRTLLQLVASLLSLAVLSVVLYLVYKFWLARQSPE